MFPSSWALQGVRGITINPATSKPKCCMLNMHVAPNLGCSQNGERANTFMQYVGMLITLPCPHLMFCCVSLENCCHTRRYVVAYLYLAASFYAVQSILSANNTHTIRCFLLNANIRSTPIIIIDRSTTATSTEATSGCRQEVI